MNHPIYRPHESRPPPEPLRYRAVVRLVDTGEQAEPRHEPGEHGGHADASQGPLALPQPGVPVAGHGQLEDGQEAGQQEGEEEGAKGTPSDNSGALCVHPIGPGGGVCRVFGCCSAEFGLIVLAHEPQPSRPMSQNPAWLDALGRRSKDCLGAGPGAGPARLFRADQACSWAVVSYDAHAGCRAAGTRPSLAAGCARMAHIPTPLSAQTYRRL